MLSQSSENGEQLKSTFRSLDPNACECIAGRVIRQETVTVANGQMCIRNLTMVGEMVNVECSCRNLSKYT